MKTQKKSSSMWLTVYLSFLMLVLSGVDLDAMTTSAMAKQQATADNFARSF